MKILVLFIENTFQVLSVIGCDCKGFKKKTTYCVLYFLVRDSCASIPTVQHCSKIMFVHDWPVCNPDLPPIVNLHQNCDDRCKKKIWNADIFLISSFFSVRSNRSQRNTTTPCPSTHPGPGFYGTLCLTTPSALMPESNGNTS